MTDLRQPSTPALERMHQKFLWKLRRSEFATEASCRLLKSRGIAFTYTRPIYCPTYAEIPEYRGRTSVPDIKTAIGDVEVKFQKDQFTSPHDYPHPTIIVATVCRHNLNPPAEYHLWSENLLAVAIVPSTLFPSLQKREIVDSRYGKSEMRYEIPMSLVEITTIPVPDLQDAYKKYIRDSFLG